MPGQLAIHCRTGTGRSAAVAAFFSPRPDGALADEEDVRQDEQPAVSHYPVDLGDPGCQVAPMPHGHGRQHQSNVPSANGSCSTLART
jgi:hypothetical protein